MTRKIPIALYCVVGIGLIIQGVRYLGGSEIAPYHLAVIDTSWTNIDGRYQQLLLGLYRGFGAGFLCVGLSTIILALIFARTKDRWAQIAAPGIAGSYTAALVFVTSSALLPGANPVTVSAVLFSAIALAGLLTCFDLN